MNLVASLRRSALINPRGLAIRQGSLKQSWPEFVERIALIAGRLRARGVNRDTHVAVLGLNSPETLETMLAVWWAGGVLVPLNTRLAWDEYEFILTHSQTRLLITDTQFESIGERAQHNVGELQTLSMADSQQDLMQASAVEAAQFSGQDLAALFYTGGTTGMPKGVMLAHQSFVVAALNMQRDLDVTANCVYLNSSPLFHLAGFITSMSMLLGGACQSFLDRFTPESFFQRLREDEVTHIMLVPTTISALLDSPARDGRALAAIRSLAYGAAPIVPSLLERVLAALPNSRLTQFYGMTEVCGASTRLPPYRHVLEGNYKGKLNSVGQPLETFEFMIARADGCPCAVDEPGEVLMRGPAVMLGYWQAPDQTSQAFCDGWLRSGDVGRMDEDGFLYLVDRLKDMIISGGENVYSVEVEAALLQNPAIASSAVIGVPDEKWGERVHAVVVLRVGATLNSEDVMNHCRTLIAGYKCPRSVEFVDALPLSAVGKVLKTEIRKSHRHAQSAQIV